MSKTKIQLSDHFTFRRLMRFVLPSIFMMIVTSIYGVIDGLFISNIAGKTQFAAINLIMPFLMILGGMGFMIGTGGSALISKNLGEGKKERANEIFSSLILFAILLGVVLTAFGEISMRWIALLLGADESMLDYCVLYGRIVAAFTSFYILQNIFQSILATAEKPKLGFLVTLLAGCTNAILDAIFIAGFGWGIVGAAIATGIGQMVGSVIPLVYFIKKNGSLLRLKKPKFEFKVILKACGNGSSELLTNVATSVVSMFYNFQLMQFYGEDGVSAYGVLMYVQLVFLAIEIGCTIGVSPLVAYNYGSRNDKELKNIFKKSVLIEGVSGILLSGLAQVLAIPLSMLFVGYDQGLYELTVHAFRLFSFSFVFSGIAIFSSGFFTALNNGWISAFLSFMRSFVLQACFVFILPIIFGMEAIWWASFATECVATLIALAFFVIKRNKYHYF